MTKQKSNNFGERLFAEGVSVSNDSRQTGLNNNDLIIGSSSSGKTGTYIFQMLLNPHGSYIVSDTKGRLCRLFGDYLKAKGYKVSVLDFVRPSQSIAYNPLSYIGRKEDGSLIEKDVKKLASDIVPSLDKEEPFWEKAAMRYITMLIAYVLEALPENHHCMSSVVRFHEAFNEGKGRILLEEWAECHPDSLAARKYSEMSETHTAEKMWLSIMEFANESLDPFSYKEYEPIFGIHEGIDFASLGDEKTVLFINSSDNDTSFHILSNILFSQALQNLIEKADMTEDGRLPVPVRLIMDDFASGPMIRDFDNVISVIRSRDISVSIIIQSISQLWTKYSEHMGTTIINNCDHILYLAGHDLQTARYMSAYIDRTPNTVLNLPRQSAVFIEDGAKARIVTKLTPYSVDVKSLLEKLERAEGISSSDSDKGITGNNDSTGGNGYEK